MSFPFYLLYDIDTHYFSFSVLSSPLSRYGIATLAARTPTFYIHYSPHALNTRASARAHIHVLHPRALVHTCTHVYSDGAQAERPITVREYFLEGRRSRSKATGGRRGGRTVEVGESGRTEVVVVRKRRVEEEGSEASVAASLTPRSLFLGRKSTWPDDCVCRLNGPVATAAAVCHYCSTAPHTAAS